MGQTEDLDADAATMEAAHRPTVVVLGALGLGWLSELSPGRQGTSVPLGRVTVFSQAWGLGPGSGSDLGALTLLLQCGHFCGLG